MKIVYIAHPIGGDVEGNLKKIADIAQDINLNEQDVVPFTPYYLDCHCLTDSNPEERARGIKNDTALLKRGFVDEMRLYGSTISKGMYAEVLLARELNIRIVFMTTETEKSYFDIFH